MEEQDTHRETETNEEENRDRKQSGTEARRRKGGRRRIKMRRRNGDMRKEGEREKDEEDEAWSNRARRRSSALAGLPREKKRRGPRSVLPVRIPTGSPVLAIQTRKRRRERKRDKRIYLPAQREYPC